MRLLGQLPHLALEEVPRGEEELADLGKVDLRQEVRLVLHRVG